jgi:hypothetical protein
MPDDLYHRDVLLWSEQQADLLRRIARGERVNGLDWEQVAEEIEDVGISELNAVRAFLRLMIVHLLKVRGWPDSPSLKHWRGEIAGFQSGLQERYAPSMRQKLDLPRIYQRAREELADIDYDGRPPQPWPDKCPFTLDLLLSEPRAALEALLTSPPNS